MDFLERVKEYMEGLLYTPSIINIGMYNTESNSLAVRVTPSNINSRDMSKGKIYPFSFQILIHHSNNLSAYKMGQDLLKDLENSKTQIASSNDSFVLVGIKNTTVPNFVEETSHGSLWTAMFEAELYIKGGQ